MPTSPWTTSRATLRDPTGADVALFSTIELAERVAATLNGARPSWGGCSADCARRPGCCCPDYLLQPVADRVRLEDCA